MNYTNFDFNSVEITPTIRNTLLYTSSLLITGSMLIDIPTVELFVLINPGFPCFPCLVSYFAIEIYFNLVDYSSFFTLLNRFSNSYLRLRVSKNWNQFKCRAGSIFKHMFSQDSTSIINSSFQFKLLLVKTYYGCFITNLPLLVENFISNFIKLAYHSLALVFIPSRVSSSGFSKLFTAFGWLLYTTTVLGVSISDPEIDDDVNLPSRTNGDRNPDFPTPKQTFVFPETRNKTTIVVEPSTNQASASDNRSIYIVVGCLVGVLILLLIGLLLFVFRRKTHQKLSSQTNSPPGSSHPVLSQQHLSPVSAPVSEPSPNNWDPTVTYVNPSRLLNSTTYSSSPTAPLHSASHRPERPSPREELAARSQAWAHEMLRAGPASHHQSRGNHNRPSPSSSLSKTVGLDVTLVGPPHH